MASEIDVFEHNGFRVAICIDPDPEDPRREYEQVSTIACWHQRRRIGDRQIEPCSAEQLTEQLAETGDRVIAIRPVYCYEHGGITISTGPFADRFDSGQVGWAYVLQTVADSAGIAAEEADLVIELEIATYDQFLRGDVYGFVVETADEPREHVDSCWGFYAGLDEVRSAARDAAASATHPGRADGREDVSCVAPEPESIVWIEPEPEVMATRQVVRNTLAFGRPVARRPAEVAALRLRVLRALESPTDMTKEGVVDVLRDLWLSANGGVV